jgi:fused signal recognition particle receptor
VASGTLWIIVAVVVAVLLIAVALGLVLRRQRRISLREPDRIEPEPGAAPPRKGGSYKAESGFSFSAGTAAPEKPAQRPTPPTAPPAGVARPDAPPSPRPGEAPAASAPAAPAPAASAPAVPETATAGTGVADTAVPDTATRPPASREAAAPTAPSGSTAAPARPAEAPPLRADVPDIAAAEGTAASGTVAPERPAPEQPAPERPAPEQPVIERPTPERPAPERPAPERPAPERPAPERPTSEPPAGDRPAPTLPKTPYPPGPAPAGEPRSTNGAAPTLPRPAPPVAMPPAPAAPAPSEAIDPAEGRLDRLRGRLARSRSGFGQGLLGLLGAGELDEESWEDVEAMLLQADLGPEMTVELVETLRVELARRAVRTTAQAKQLLREVLTAALRPELDRSVRALPHDGRPAVLLVVGVNGTGKTTTTGKLARVLVAGGRHVVLGAADTFRAAAAEQLGTWGQRAGATVVRGAEGADPASVAFDAVRQGTAEGADAVLLDTAGRLHTKTGLMDELGKVKRVVSRQAEVDEVLLVLDATTGQNGLTQARVFGDVVDVSGIVLTKLDGTAKGGIVFRVQRELGVPVKLVGLGEGPDDLAPFEPAAFVDALLN